MRKPAKRLTVKQQKAAKKSTDRDDKIAKWLIFVLFAVVAMYGFITPQLTSKVKDLSTTTVGVPNLQCVLVDPTKALCTVKKEYKLTANECVVVKRTGTDVTFDALKSKTCTKVKQILKRQGK